ncbi:MAG: GyrI-like domain-containing protein [Pseudomonadota bacterium]
MSYEIEVIEADPTPAAVIETRCATAELGEVLGQCFGRVVQHIMGSGHTPLGMPFLRYLEMTPDSLLIQAGLPSTAPAGEDVLAIELPGGKLATTLYLGPYGDVGPAWEAMGAWAAERGLSFAGGWDVYENDPDTVADESELRTRLFLPAE